MKTTLLAVLFLLSVQYAKAQNPEWAVINFQEFILYDAVTDYCDFDLTRQEILELSIGENNELWMTTQDYKIKFLPNNILIYSWHDLNNSLCNCPSSLNAILYYSVIGDSEIADIVPENTWVKYYDFDNYEYAIKSNEKKITDESFFDFHSMNNYAITLKDKNEVSYNEIINSKLFSYPILSMELSFSIELLDERKPIINANEKLNYKKYLKKRSQSEIIFDMLTDSRGIVWLATGKKLIKFDGKKFFELNIPAIALELDHQNNLWIGTAAYNSLGSLIKYDNSKFTYYNSLNTPLPENDGFLDLKTDYYGNLWISLKRTGLPYELDDIKLAVYNPSGVRYITDVFIESIYWNREPIDENIKTLFTEKVDVNIYAKSTLQFNKIDALIDGVVIKTLYPEDRFKDEDHINFSCYLEKPDKYLFTFYLYTLNNTKIELASVDLNYQFSESGFYLSQNEPNPFLDQTRIEYGIFQGQLVEIKFFDSFIRQIDRYSEYYVDWIGKPYIFKSDDLSNGVYSYYLKENNYGILDCRKMLLFNPKKL